MTDPGAVLLTVAFAVYGFSSAPLFVKRWFDEDPFAVDDDIGHMKGLIGYAALVIIIVLWLLAVEAFLLPPEKAWHTQLAAALFGSSVLGFSVWIRLLLESRGPSGSIQWRGRTSYHLLTGLGLIVIPSAVGWSLVDSQLYGLIAAFIVFTFFFYVARKQEIERRRSEAAVAAAPTQQDERSILMQQMALDRLRWFRRRHWSHKEIAQAHGVPTSVVAALDRLRETRGHGH